METARYVLMHRNDEAAVLEFNQTEGYLMRVLEKRNENLIPFRANHSPEDFADWWRERAVPRTQGSILGFLRECNIPTTQSYLLRNLGLSLSDHYWVRPAKSSLTWEGVNLFTNDFSDPVSLFHGFAEDSGLSTSFSPSASTGGELQKRWIIKDGTRYLIKDNAGLSFQQSINEVFATWIHEGQKQFSFVPYSLVRTHGSRKYSCVCACFTSTTQELIPAWDLVGRHDRDKNEPFCENFIKSCVKGGLKEEYVQSFLDYQAMTDFLISNIDRHMNNFGVLRDTNTLDFISMAPIFDSGNSMFYEEPTVAISDKKLLFLKTKGFFSTERANIEHVRNIQCVAVDKLPSPEEVANLYAKDPVLVAAKYNTYIAQGYTQKIALIKQLQRGFSFGQLVE